MHNYKLVKLPKFQVCNFKNKKSTPQKPKKYGAFFAPFSHLLHFCTILSMLIFKNIITKFLGSWQNFWYVTSILLMKKIFGTFSAWVYFTPVFGGSNSRKILIFFQNITLYDISNHFIIRIIMEKNILVTLKKPYVHLAPQWIQDSD